MGAQSLTKWPKPPPAGSVPVRMSATFHGHVVGCIQNEGPFIQMCNYCIIEVLLYWRSSIIPSSILRMCIILFCNNVCLFLD